MDSDRNIIGCLATTFLAFFILGFVWLAWYQAGIQVEVYRRQNVEMTRREVFMGCTPAERQIHFEKPSDQKELEQHGTN